VFLRIRSAEDIWTDEIRTQLRKLQTKTICYREISGLNRRRSKKKMPIAEGKAVGRRSEISQARERLSPLVDAAKGQDCYPEQQTGGRVDHVDAQLLAVEPKFGGG
jgi:hypothetical protein